MPEPPHPVSKRSPANGTVNPAAADGSTMRIADFDHEPGAHCGSTSLRNLADHYGWGLSEPACFGLASGLGFSYFELPRDPWRLFVGRPMWLEAAFFDHLDVPHTEREAQDWETAWGDVRERVDAGDPVLVFVDLYYLDYYGTDTHFAPHSLLVVGYDDDHAYMADSEFAELQRLPLSSLRAAWSSTDLLPLANRWIAVDGDPRRPVDAAAGRAVAETAAYMLGESVDRPVLSFGESGVAGIRALAADLPGWTGLEDPRWAARFAYQNVEKRGTGGGAFRGLYAPFLSELGEAAGLDASFADRMAAIADDWTAAGEVLERASDSDDGALGSLLAEAGDRVDALAEREAAFFGDVRDALDGTSREV